MGSCASWDGRKFATPPDWPGRQGWAARRSRTRDPRVGLRSTPTDAAYFFCRGRERLRLRRSHRACTRMRAASDTSSSRLRFFRGERWGFLVFGMGGPQGGWATAMRLTLRITRNHKVSSKVVHSTVGGTNQTCCHRFVGFLVCLGGFAGFGGLGGFADGKTRTRARQHMCGRSTSRGGGAGRVPGLAAGRRGGPSGSLGDTLSLWFAVRGRGAPLSARARRALGSSSAGCACRRQRRSAARAAS